MSIWKHSKLPLKQTALLCRIGFSQISDCSRIIRTEERGQQTNKQKKNQCKINPLKLGTTLALAHAASSRRAGLH